MLVALLLLAFVGGAGGAVGLLYTFDGVPRAMITQRPQAGEVWNLHGWGDVDVWGVYTQLKSEQAHPMIAVVPMGGIDLHWMRLADFQKRARPIPFDTMRNENFAKRRDRMRARWRRGR